MNTAKNPDTPKGQEKWSDIQKQQDHFRAKYGNDPKKKEWMFIPVCEKVFTALKDGNKQAALSYVIDHKTRVQDDIQVINSNVQQKGIASTVVANILSRAKSFANITVTPEKVDPSVMTMQNYYGLDVTAFIKEMGTLIATYDASSESVS